MSYFITDYSDMEYYNKYIFENIGKNLELFIDNENVDFNKLISALSINSNYISVEKTYKFKYKDLTYVCYYINLNNFYYGFTYVIYDKFILFYGWTIDPLDLINQFNKLKKLKQINNSNHYILSLQKLMPYLDGLKVYYNSLDILNIKNNK